MPFHTALDRFRTPTDGLTTEKLLEECQQSSEDLCTMLFEYFGKHIVQPRHDLFEQATKMKISQSCDTGFLTKVEATAAMETCKHLELFEAHADAANRHNGSSSRRPKDKKGKGKGGKGNVGGKGLSLHYLQPSAAATAQQQPPSASPTAYPVSPARQQGKGE